MSMLEVGVRNLELVLSIILTRPTGGFELFGLWSIGFQSVVLQEGPV